MIKEYLKNAAGRSKLSHAYIIKGNTRDMRKKAAEDFINAFMNKDEHAAAQIKAGTHPDIIRINHEKPLSISVKEVRSQICDTMSVRPFEGGWKMYIMDEAELMTPGAQNALLKTIEEPPEYGCILLMTGNPEMLLDTIKSRCICLKCDEEEETPEFSGSEILNKLNFDSYAGREHLKSDEASVIAEAALENGTESALKFLDYLRTRIHNLMTEHSGAGTLDLTRVYRALKLIDEADTKIRFNVNAQLTIEMMLMEI